MSASTPQGPDTDVTPAARRFGTYAWSTLFFTFAVILWGAFVRISFSGDGCGNHWPLCNGEVFPTSANVNTWIEFSHRLSTGVLGFLVAGLVVWAFRAFPRGSSVRKASLVVLFFLIVEAMVGMGLVKFGWVARDASAERAVVQSVHLANTFMLIAAMGLCALWATGTPRPSFKGQGAMGWALAIALISMVAIGVSGAVTALGDTLYPLASGHASLADINDPAKHFLVRLRVVHPILALVVGLVLTLVAGLAWQLRPSEGTRRAAMWVVTLFTVQMGLGFLNVWLKAPLVMQMLHLLVADATWIATVALVAASVATGVERVEFVAQSDEERAHTEESHATWKDYVALTKPRVISLLLFTTLAAMFASAGGWPGLTLLLAVTIGGYMSAGAANTINMVLERDLDARMRRTAQRPTITRNIPAPRALAFGLLMGAGAFGILWAFANLLAATLSLAGLVFYVVVYTLVLKRRTWQNIVIGGAAGAFPPLVGWAAASGELNILAWTLFGIVFLWTPVHFWALSLLIKDDYANAGVPMLPVVRGVRATVTQIVGYAILTVLLTALPPVLGQSGPLYLGVAIVLNIILMVRSVQLYSDPERPRAVTLYKFSMLYLAVLFLTVAVDQARLG